MKHKIVITVAQQVFEFEGLIREMTDNDIILEAEHGDIFIERKYLVFIQELKAAEPIAKPPLPQKASPIIDKPRIDAAARFVNRQLKHDPLDERLSQKVVHPAEMPDSLDDLEIDEDTEAVKNIIGHNFGADHPFVQEVTLKQAIRGAMSNTMDDFTVEGPEYRTPLQTVMGMKNVGSKKRDS
jgi:hypothetical protein